MNWPRIDRTNTPLGRLRTTRAPRAAAIPRALRGGEHGQRLLVDLYQDPDGTLVLVRADGSQEELAIKNGEPGLDGYTPKKGKDYFDGLPGISVTGSAMHGPQLVLNLSNGKNLIVGKIVGADGYSPKKGVDYFDGKHGKTPVKGVDYKDGDPGPAGASVSRGYEKAGHLVLGLDSGLLIDVCKLPVADPLPPLPALEGEPGATGPTPRHQIKGGAIRFAQKMSKTGLKVLEWGEYLDLSKWVRDLTRQHRPEQPLIVGSGLSEARVLQLIEENAVSESSEIEHTHAAINVTASGDTTVLTPADPAKCISIVRISAMSDMDETDSPLIKIGFGTSGGSITTEKFRGAVISARQLCVGGAGQSVIVNLESAAKVDGTIIYDEVTP